MPDSRPSPVAQLDLFADEAGEYLTLAEAARRVRCCERTIRRAVENGSLRAGRIRATRFSRGAIRIRDTTAAREHISVISSEMGGS